MTAIPKIIEGTWEEIQQHAPELAGHRLRITVLAAEDSPTPATSSPKSAEEIEAWVQRLYQWARTSSVKVTGPVDTSRDLIYEDRLKL